MTLTRYIQGRRILKKSAINLAIELVQIDCRTEIRRVKRHDHPRPQERHIEIIHFD